jgi:hypothetical protein
MLVPLYGFLEGDALGLLVLIHDHEPVHEIGVRLQEAAAIRIAPAKSFGVYHRGVRLEGNISVAAAGLTALSRVDVRQED